MKLSGLTKTPIKKLQGFKSFHSVPKDITNATRAFTKKCAVSEIEQELESVWTACRQEFGYKRKDRISASIEDGRGSLLLKDFTYSIVAEQDESDPTSILWQRIVDEIKNPHILLADPFNKAFGQSFESIEANFLKSQGVEEIIDGIEGLNVKNISLEYPIDCSVCTMSIRGLGVSIEITSDHYKIYMNGHTSPKILAEKILAFQRAILAPEPEQFLPLFT